MALADQANFGGAYCYGTEVTGEEKRTRMFNNKMDLCGGTSRPKFSPEVVHMSCKFGRIGKGCLMVAPV